MRKLRETPTQAKVAVATGGFALIGVYNTFRLAVSSLSSLIAYAVNESEGAWTPTVIALVVIAWTCYNLMTRYFNTPAEQPASQKLPIPNDELFRLFTSTAATQKPNESDKAVEVLAQGFKKLVTEQSEKEDNKTIDENVAELNKKIAAEARKSSDEEIANELMQEAAPGLIT